MSILKDMVAAPHRYQACTVVVIWSIRDGDHFEWFQDDLVALLRAQASAIATGVAMPQLRVHVFLTSTDTRTASTGEMPPSPVTGDFGSSHASVVFKKGRPSLEGLLGPFLDPSLPPSSPDPPTAFLFACGPASLVTACWDYADERRRHGVAVDFHRETFNF